MAPRPRGELLPPLLLLLLLLVPSTCLALSYVHDELLWTKAHWKDYTLPFPWAAVLKHRDDESTRNLEGPLQGFAINSLNGPVGHQAQLDLLIDEDVRRGPGLQTSSGLEMSIMDASASLEAAAGVAQCKVCGVLAKHLWTGVTRWINRKRQVPSSLHIESYARDICQYEVMNEVLRDWVLLRAKVPVGEAVPGLPAGLEVQEFYVLSQRTDQNAQPSEIDSVRMACNKLLHHTKDDQQSEIVRTTTAMARDYWQHFAKRVDSPVEVADDGPRVQRQCFNRHPQCDAWKLKGECESNAIYMLGEAGKESEGWCRPACGKCPAALAAEEADLLAAPGLSDADAAHLQRVSDDQLAVLQAKACIASSACQWTGGGDGMAKLLSSGSGAAALRQAAAQLMGSAGFVNGPVQTREEALAASIDYERVASSKLMAVKDVGEALAPRSAGVPPMKRADPPDAAASIPSAQALWRELGNKCLYYNGGWWMYEVCPWRHITQYHPSDARMTDWVISLGHYQGVEWAPTNASQTSLYSKGTKVPYVEQRYALGNICELDGVDARGKRLEPVLRRTALRLMCSPSGEAHVVVSELQQCVYRVELYVPSLCTVPGFEVTPAPGGGADGDWDDDDDDEEEGGYADDDEDDSDHEYAD